MTISLDHHREMWARTRVPESNRDAADKRDQYSREYARLVHSAAFRRLQNKTQVLGLGENDFYRTRLTHSLEVMQIGAGIIECLIKSDIVRQRNSELVDYLPPVRLMEAICLAHDIGHPPFGHGGEVALNFCMLDHGGFEGNGQTLRILSRLEKFKKDHGINPSRRLLLGILKYPAPYSRVVNPQVVAMNHKPFSHATFRIKNAKPPKCYLDTETEVVDWILESLEDVDKNLLVSVQTQGNEKHSRTSFMSLDTSILELADDISYGVHDLEDGIGLKLILRIDWEGITEKIPNGLQSFHREMTDKLFSGDTCDRKAAIGSLVHLFISKVTINTDKNFNDPLLKYSINLDDEHHDYLSKLKGLTVEKMIKNPNVQLLEYKGMTVVIKLFEILSAEPERFLPQGDRRKYKALPESGEERPRFICDYVAGMTDSYATKLYEKVMLPGHGSFLDLL